MKKPNNYEDVQVQDDFTPLEAGGHICKIMHVEETKSKSGLDMLVISLDTDKDDPQPNYYSESYKNDTREDKKWGCNVWLVVDENTEYGPRNLKTFCDAVENSNTGFEVSWGDAFAKCFDNKRVGVVFRREQYENSAGAVKWNTKPKWFRKVDGILSAKVPDDLFLDKPSTTSTDGWMDLSKADKEEIPWS